MVSPGTSDYLSYALSGEAAERKYQRASCRFPATIQHGGQQHRALMITVGLGGGYLHTDLAPRPNEQLELSISMPQRRATFPCIARVVWTWDQLPKESRRGFPRGFAVEFFRMDPEHKEFIDNYVRHMVRAFRTMAHEMESARPDTALIKSIFREVRPGESTHMNHIRKVVKEEMKHFRLRK